MIRPTQSRIFDVTLTALDGCQGRVHAQSAAHAKTLAVRGWLEGDDIVAFMADDDLWDVRELLPS